MSLLYHLTMQPLAGVAVSCTLTLLFEQKALGWVTSGAAGIGFTVTTSGASKLRQLFPSMAAA